MDEAVLIEFLDAMGEQSKKHNIVKETLAKGIPAYYMSEEYPGLILEALPSGEIFSVALDEVTYEVIQLERVK